MSTLTEIQESIEKLPEKDFYQLESWMSEQHLARFREDEYESPELEAELLKGLEGPFVPMDDAFFARLRGSIDAAV